MAQMSSRSNSDLVAVDQQHLIFAYSLPNRQHVGCFEHITLHTVSENR